MKTIFLNLFFPFFGIILMGGCKKETLPPVKCYNYNIRLLPVAQSTNPVDSVHFHLQRSDVDNGQTFDTTFLNPSAAFLFSSQFCGVFKYKIDIYNTPSNVEDIFVFSVGSNEIEDVNIVGNTTIEGYYVNEFSN